MHYLVISFSHKNSTISVREKLAFSSDEIVLDALSKLYSIDTISEIFLLSTCNRIEIYCSCGDIKSTTHDILEFLSNHSKISISDLYDRADIYDDRAAIYHLFSVASSLDSLVVGETQIAGQLKDAFRLAYDNSFASQKLSRAINYASKCAADIRNKTDISSKPVSVASVAVAKAKELVGDMSGKKALVVGSGEMATIAIKHLISGGADVTIINRTHERAKELAHELGAKAIEYDELESALGDYELLFSATSAFGIIIDDDMVSACGFSRYWFDLALPRDIELEKNEHNIELFYVDDLREIVERNMSLREDEAKSSHIIVRTNVAEFYQWLKRQSIEPLIKSLYERAYEASSAESARVIESGFIPKEYEASLQKATHQALKRFLHPFSSRMRDSSDGINIDDLIESLSFLIDSDKIKK